MIIKLIDRPEVKRIYDPFDFFKGEVPVIPVAIQYNDIITDSDALFYIKFTEKELNIYYSEFMKHCLIQRIPPKIFFIISEIILKRELMINLEGLNKNGVKYEVIS